MQKLNKTTKLLINKWANEMNRQFLKRRNTNSQYFLKCSIWLLIREVQIKPFRDSLLPHSERIKKTEDSKCVRLWGKRSPMVQASPNAGVSPIASHRLS